MDNKEQSGLWNGAAGEAWVEAQQLLDRMFEPFELLLAREAAASNARSVLDVGCGTGATTLAIVAATGGEAMGVDISRPMIALAEARSRRADSKARFVVADAQTHVFPDAHYDRIVSRFGVMFFSDPVAAFTNLRRAAIAGASLQCIAFRSAAENPFMTAAERAAAPLLPDLPARKPEGPGQFALADSAFVRHVLEAAGWKSIAIQPLDMVCTMPASALDQYLTRLGPVGLILRNADENTKARVLAAVHAAFAPWVHGDEIRFDAACWDIQASS